MHVEVNETNIAVYDLVKLTGNAREDLLSRAAEAEENGYTLYCEIPDPQGPIEVNAFQHFGSSPAPKAKPQKEDVIVSEWEGNTVRIHSEGVEIIEGEVVEGTIHIESEENDD